MMTMWPEEAPVECPEWMVSVWRTTDMEGGECGLIDLASRNTAKCLAKTSPSANFEAYACKQHNAVIEVQPTVSDGEECDDGQQMMLCVGE